MKKLKLPKILDAAKRLTANGKTQLTENKLFCLNINDDYIHKLYPLLEDKKITKPDYFGENSIGAHITIIYPEEKVIINDEDLHQEHDFHVKDIIEAIIHKKIYYVLLIESPSLLKLRKKYGLSDLLNFKGYSIGFHITIGKKLRGLPDVK